MREEKIIRVVGLSAAVPFDKNDPVSPVNRRISVIVMKKHAEDAITNDGRQVDVAGEAPAAAELTPLEAVMGSAQAPAAQPKQ
jgi:chemotaxis protein MotB